MKTTITKKEKAIEIMKKMDIYKPYINGFEQKDKVCFFEQFGGFWIDQEPELHAKMKAIEEKHKCKVYAVTHEYIRLLLMSGIRTMTGARNSAVLPYRASVAELKELREVQYESICSNIRLVHKR